MTATIAAAAGEVGLLGRVVGQRERQVVGRPCLPLASEPPQQVGAGGVQGVVADEGRGHLVHRVQTQLLVGHRREERTPAESTAVRQGHLAVVVPYSLLAPVLGGDDGRAAYPGQVGVLGEDPDLGGLAMHLGGLGVAEDVEQHGARHVGGRQRRELVLEA